LYIGFLWLAELMSSDQNFWPNLSARACRAGCGSWSSISATASKWCFTKTFIINSIAT